MGRQKGTKIRLGISQTKNNSKRYSTYYYFKFEVEFNGSKEGG